MAIGFAIVDSAAGPCGAVDKKSQARDWEVHSCGNGNRPGMAVVSAIATLQVGATLAEDPADKIALNEAADYLISTLMPQLKAFRKALAD
jgi:hypothetical protein